MELSVINNHAQKIGMVNISDDVFAREYNESLIHQLIVAYLANARLGSRAQLTRREVRHSTKKPWRQKGTARARSGMTSSPVWRGGGRAFPNKPNENFTKKVNRKMYRAGISVILSQLIRDGRLLVVESLSVSTPKTKLFIREIQNLVGVQTLFVTHQMDENIYLASRNLADVLVLGVEQVNPYSLLRYEKIILTKDAILKLEEQLI